MQHEAVHHFEAPIAAVWAMFTDPEAHVTKFDSMGHRDIKVLETTNDGTEFVIKIERVVEVDLPGFARKVLKPSNTVISTDRWRDEGDGTYGGGFVLDTIGAPVDIKGTTRLEPDGDRTTYHVTFELNVNVPLIGGKIANWAKGDALEQLQAEFDAGDAWLASH